MFHDELGREREVRMICSRMNQFPVLREAVRFCLDQLHRIAGCSAIAIRLEDDGDFPYYHQEGLSDSFLLREGPLCALTSQGERIPDPGREGAPLLECLCGSILSGRTDMLLPWCSKYGSFFINDSMGLVEETDLNLLASSLRFSCVRSGYASIGLIPVKAGGSVIGLLQVNERQSGFFSKDLRNFLEMAAEGIGPIIQAGRQREAYESLRAEYQAVREESDLKTLFLASAGQQFHTPLNSLRGMMDLLSLSPLGEEQARLVELMRKSAGSLLNILENVMDSARIGSGHLEPLKIPFNVNAFLNGLDTTFGHMAARKGLLFSLQRVGHLPDTLVGDEARLAQMLTQVIDNAVKFTEHGFVNVQVSSSQTNGNQVKLRIVVSDSGPGIPADKTEHLFIPFGNQARAEEKAAAKSMAVRYDAGSSAAMFQGRRGSGGGDGLGGGEGLGLGLPIARGLAKLMKGSLHFESGTDEGTVFVAEVLLESAGTEGWFEMAGREEMLAALRTLSHHSVLLVEDDGINAGVLTGYLAQGGMKIHRAVDARECMDLLSRYQVSAILMDIRLPGMDGCELARMIRRSETAGEHVPILAMTAQAGDSDRERCLKAGMDGYLPKPVHLGYLVDRLQAALKAAPS